MSEKLTPTGRKPTGPNLQGIPQRTEEVRAIRDAFILDPATRAEARRIASLPSFNEKREAANAWCEDHPQRDIYAFYGEINRHMGGGK